MLIITILEFTIWPLLSFTVKLPHIPSTPKVKLYVVLAIGHIISSHCKFNVSPECLTFLSWVVIATLFYWPDPKFWNLKNFLILVWRSDLHGHRKVKIVQIGILVPDLWIFQSFQVFHKNLLLFRSSRFFETETSNDIIAGNGRILSVPEYCVVIFV